MDKEMSIMDNPQNNHTFQCPECITGSLSDDHFCSPFRCPERISTPLFSSPNSPLPPEKLAELKKCIKAANEMLLTIGTRRDPAMTRKLQLRFLALRNALLKVKIDCHDTTHEILGQLETAGKNFIQLNVVGSRTFILFERICSVTHDAETKGHAHLSELIEIDTCVRRELLLNFGPFVSRRPDIANQIFGILLYLQLLSFIGCQALVKKNGEEELIKGILCESEEGAILLKSDSNDCKLERINFNEICYITLKK